MKTRLLLLLAMVGIAGSTPRLATAQRVAIADQFYYPAAHNWAFRRTYPEADRLFNAFDYGHAILYEKLWTRPGAPVAELEGREFDYITRTLLVKPPRMPLAEAAIEPEYAKLAPEAKRMFDWAHVLHRQVYDIWSDERIPDSRKDAEVAKVFAYYRSRPDLAFSSKPKSMDLMVGQPYSLAFSKRYPKFNGLIWSYHWLQMALYEPMLAGTTPEERRAGVRAAVARFRAMVDGAPGTLPSVMPMTPVISPRFTERYPEIAAVFDNLHSMHDVVSDILLNDVVPRAQKRSALLKAAAAYRDDVTAVTTVAEWKEMAQMMGVAEMGGAAVTPPEPTETFAQMHARHHPEQAQQPPASTPTDSAFKALQSRGAMVMGVDQYSSQHRFEDRPDGGAVILERDSTDAAGVATIRAHLREVRDRISKGDFSLSEAVHASHVIPGTAVLRAKSAALTVSYVDRPGGGEVRLSSVDPEVVKAIREFLVFQRSEHRTP